jgi:hypothetical protein
MARLHQGQPFLFFQDSHFQDNRALTVTPTLNPTGEEIPDGGCHRGQFTVAEGNAAFRFTANCPAGECVLQ